MHVAYIHQHFSTKKGATGTRSYEMSRRLIQAGHSVTMICGEYAVGDQSVERTGKVTEFEVDGIRVLRVAEPYGNEMTFTQRVRSFGRFAKAATRLVKRTDADLVFATSTPLTVGIPGMKGARRLKAPFVFEVRDLWPELAIALGVLTNPFMRSYAQRLERKIYRAATRIIALAPGIKEGVAKKGYPPAQIDMIPNGCDVDLFVPTEERLEMEEFGSPDEVRFIFTGAHGLANGLDAVLDAAAELMRREEYGVRFIFLGQGNQKQALVDRAEAEGLTEVCTFVDSIPKNQLGYVLPRLDVGLMILKNVPSFYYGTSPNKFFDYIAAGIPVLNNYPGWLAEMIREHGIGMAVPPDDASAFADAVVYLRDHPDVRAGMGERARQMAEREFARDKLGDQFVRALEQAHSEYKLR